ncbi:hypothetical protein [Streptomyces sp. NPDC049555]|uniref:hypothetical protein n=1 Tax=Streptomyces sp. NPDC049555 TaxID=3154930 RepID=UPI00343F67B3
MPFGDGPSAADQQLIDHASHHGFAVTAKQLASWRRTGLLPRNVSGGGLGQGRGSSSWPPAESFDLVVALARCGGRGKRPADLALLLFGDGLPVPEVTVRAAFRAAVDTVVIPDDETDSGDGADLDVRLDHLAAHLADTGQAVTLVPARARRIDERITRALGGPPAGLAELDKNAAPTPLTPQDAALTAVTATLGSSVTLQEVGDLLRAMSPAMPAHPIASLVEATQEDIPDAAAKVLTDDGSLTVIPDGDVRDLLRTVADSASLHDLAAGWKTALRVREWALDLCERVEAELNAGELGEAVTEWLHGRLLLSGLSVLEVLRDRRWSPSKGALSTLGFLLQRTMLATIGTLVPGCQWHVLEMPGVLPPPVRDFLLTKGVGPANRATPGP